LLKAADALQLAFLAVPIAGLVFTFVRIGHRGGRGAWRWSAGSAPRRAMVLSSSVVLLGLLAFAWWPDGRTTPYRPGERGTLTQQVVSLQYAGHGSPYLPNPRQAATTQLPPVAPGTTAGDLARHQSQQAPAGSAPAPATPSGSTGTGTGPGGTAPSPAPASNPSSAPSSAPSNQPTSAPSSPAPTPSATTTP
jgi:hypothetical protein